MTRQNSSSGASVTGPSCSRRSAGVVVQDVELAVAGDGFRNRGLDARPVGDVATQEMGIAAGIGRDRARRRGRGLAGGDIDVGDDDLGALLREALRGGAADAAAAAGDEGHLARQPRHSDPLPWWIAVPSP